MHHRYTAFLVTDLQPRILVLFWSWFSNLPSQNMGSEDFPYHSPFNHFIACALDKGLVFCRGDGYISRWLTVVDESNNERNFSANGDGCQSVL